MEEKEARTILEEQFKLLANVSKECNKECLKEITEAMIMVYGCLDNKKMRLLLKYQFKSNQL